MRGLEASWGGGGSNRKPERAEAIAVPIELSMSPPKERKQSRHTSNKNPQSHPPQKIR